MKKSLVWVLLIFFVIIGFFAWKDGGFIPKFLMREVKGWMFKDRINQMFIENQVLIDRLLAACENTDGENMVVDKSNQISLDPHNMINTYRDIILNEKSESKIDERLLNKIKEQLYPIRSDYNKLVDKYKNIINQKSQVGSGINEKLIGYTLNELWMETFWILGSSLASDLNDYRRKKKAVAMGIIESYLNNYDALADYLRNRILLEAAESGELKKAFLEIEQERLQQEAQ